MAVKPKAPFKPMPTVGRFRKLLRSRRPLEVETLDQIDAIIAARKKEPARYRPL